MARHRRETIDAKIAELIDSKAGLAAQALDGSDEEVGSSADVQHEALVALLTDAPSGPPRDTARAHMAGGEIEPGSAYRCGPDRGTPRPPDRGRH